MDTQEAVTVDGEVLSTALAVVEPNRLSEIARVEIDQQIATAHRFPRSIQKSLGNILTLATLDEETAEGCIYALPRGGKPIRGPSVRLAEIVAGQWRNCRVEASITAIDRTDKFVEATATFHDLETNVAQRTTVRRGIVDRRGRIFNDDMIIVTGQAACSIARRNIILACVPKAVWNKAYQEAERIVKGDARTLAERRAAAIAAFGTWGVTPERVFAALGVAGVEEVTLDHIPTLRGMFSAIKNGETTVEDLFSGQRTAGPQGFEPIKNPLQSKATAASAETVVVDPKDPRLGARGTSAEFAAADRVATTEGVVLKSRDDAVEGLSSVPTAPAADREAALSTARLRGVDAAKKGRLRAKALPEAYGADQELEAAFLAGFDSERAGGAANA